MLYGALFGDIIGSLREIHNEKTEDIELFPKGSHFTDDSVMTIAIADKLIHDDKAVISNKKAYAMWYKQYYRRFPNVGYGQMFSSWANEEVLSVQKSYGNGSSPRWVCRSA